MMNRARGLLVGLILAMCLGASAQTSPGFNMPSLWYNPALMMDPAVQKELNVSPQVANKAVQAMMQEAMKIGPAMMGAMNGKTPTPAQIKQATEALARMQSESTKDLTPAQKHRLHEITLQSYGAKALLDPKVGAQLNLTDAQATSLQKALRKLSQEQAAEIKASMSGSKGGSPMSGLQGVAERSRAKSDAVLDSLLSPSQKAKWKALQGRPVTLGPLARMMGG